MQKKFEFFKKQTKNSKKSSRYLFKEQRLDFLVSDDKNYQASLWSVFGESS